MLIVIFSYNGVCKQVNLMLLLVIFLYKFGFFVVVYGVSEDLICVLIEIIFELMGITLMLYGGQVQVKFDEY